MDRRDLWLILAAIAVAIFAVSVRTDYHRYQVAVRAHNLDVFYKSMTCDDLPVDVTDCEVAVGRFVLPETRLFTRTLNGKT